MKIVQKNASRFRLLVLSLLIIWLLAPILTVGFQHLGSENSTDAISIFIKAVVAFLCFVIFQVIQSNQADRPADHFLQSLSISFFAACVVVIILVVIVNPWSLYGTHFFEPRLNPSRIDKLASYAKMTQTPDLVITGSSPAFTISPLYIQKTLGISAFNWSADSAKVSEVPVYLHLMLDSVDKRLPKVILVEVNYLPGDFSRVPLPLLKYLKFKDLLIEAPDRFLKIFSFKQVVDAIYVLNHLRFPNDLEYTWSFGSDGSGVRLVDDHFDDVVINRQLDRIPKCDSINQTDLVNSEEIISMVQKEHSAVIFYFSPVLPSFYAQHIQEVPASMRCIKIMQDYLTGISNPQRGVYFLDYTLLSSIHGLDGEAGFYDAKHITPANGERLIDAASSTIVTAYQWATH